MNLFVRRRFDFEGAKRYALDRLEKELSPHLYYHSLVHTRDDVAVAVEGLATLEGVSGQALELLQIATYYHDLGFTQMGKPGIDYSVVRTQHENMSIQMAEEILPEFGFSRRHLKVIRGLIEVTRLPQNPHTLLQMIIADADLDSLGREDYWPVSLWLQKELSFFGTVITDDKWLIGQYRFLSGHHYFSQAACKLRNEQKRINIRGLVERMRTSKLEIPVLGN